MKKLSEWFWKMWKDPVWSKVIANFISWSLPILGTAVGIFIWFYVAADSFIKAKGQVIKFLNYSVLVPVWAFFAALILIIIAFFIVIRVRKTLKNNAVKNSRHPAWDYKIGIYTMEEICLILEGQKLQVRTERMKDVSIAPPDYSLLQLLITYRKDISAGISTARDDSFYGYKSEILAPKLLEYGLVEAEHKKGGYGFQAYDYMIFYPSETGYKFFNAWDELYQSGQLLVNRTYY